MRCRNAQPPQSQQHQAKSGEPTRVRQMNNRTAPDVGSLVSFRICDVYLPEGGNYCSSSPKIEHRCWPPDRNVRLGRREDYLRCRRRGEERQRGAVVDSKPPTVMERSCYGWLPTGFS